MAWMIYTFFGHFLLDLQNFLQTFLGLKNARGAVGINKVM